MPGETNFSNSLADIQVFFRTLKLHWTIVASQRENGPTNIGVVYELINGFGASVDLEDNS